MILQPSDSCEEPELIDGCLFRCCEDICGNQFFLYKECEDKEPILDKRNKDGRLYVQDIENNRLVEFFGLNLSLIHI